MLDWEKVTLLCRRKKLFIGNEHRICLLTFDVQTHNTMDTTQNKQNAQDFYKTAFEGNPIEAISKYVGDKYIQHNPLVESGKQGFIDYFERMEKEFPDKSIKFLRSIAEGNLVALHTHQVWPTNEEEYVTMDFFRFDDNGKICEHWDSVQVIPDISENDNGML